MYNTLKIRFFDRSSITRILSHTVDENTAVDLARRWAKKLEACSTCIDNEPMEIFYGFTDYDGEIKFMDGEALVND